ncbi:MAG: hypothetical protein LBR18_00490 [Tannerella sp.]|nr:hypothetical protein [Tannerella sp.]
MLNRSFPESTGVQAIGLHPLLNLMDMLTPFLLRCVDGIVGVQSGLGFEDATSDDEASVR